MDSYEFFPARSSLQKSIGVGALYLLLAWILRSLADFSTADFALVGKRSWRCSSWSGFTGFRAGSSAYARPKPCCTVDAAGFSVRGKRRWHWNELVDVRVRRIWMGPIPIGTWVSLKIKKNGRGFAKRVEIPWSLLSGPACETSAAILRAAALAGWRP